MEEGILLEHKQCNRSTFWNTARKQKMAVRAKQGGGPGPGRGRAAPPGDPITHSPVHSLTNINWTLIMGHV